jgi:hypothetical protein
MTTTRYAAPVEAAPCSGRARRPATVLAVLAAVVMLAVACGGGSKGPGVASAGSNTPTSGGSSSSGSPRQSAVAYARCMRLHGVPDFPDPDSQGHFNAPPNLNASPQFQAAQQACKDLLPNSGGMTTGGHLSAQQQAQMLNYAKCMRAHGVQNFPDPTSTGLTLPDSVDPHSPQFQAADHACHSLLPNSGGGTQTTVGNGGGS